MLLANCSSIHFTFVLGFFFSPRFWWGCILPVTPGRDRRKTAVERPALGHLQVQSPREGQHHGRRHRWSRFFTRLCWRHTSAPWPQTPNILLLLSTGLALPAGKRLEVAARQFVPWEVGGCAYFHPSWCVSAIVTREVSPDRCHPLILGPRMDV